MLNQRRADKHISATDLGSGFAGLFYKQAKPGCCFLLQLFSSVLVLIWNSRFLLMIQCCYDIGVLKFVVRFQLQSSRFFRHLVEQNQAMICCSLGYAEASVEATISQPEPMCEISLRPTMVCLFPQLKSSFTVYGVTLPSPLLAALGYAPPTLGTWPRFFFSLVSPPKVNLIPDRGVNSGHANNDAKPCIGTFEIKTPSRQKKRKTANQRFKGG